MSMRRIVFSLAVVSCLALLVFLSGWASADVSAPASAGATGAPVAATGLTTEPAVMAIIGVGFLALLPLRGRRRIAK